VSDNWFARQLGNARQAPQQPSYPQQYQQPPQQYMPQQQQAPTPQQYYDDEQQRVALGQAGLAAIKAGQAGFSAISGLFRGSQKMRQSEQQNCPECGDPRYFTRSAITKLNAHGQQCGSQAVVTEAPVQVDAYSQRHATTYDPQRAEWIPT
jgi:hypothetical protein